MTGEQILLLTSCRMRLDDAACETIDRVLRGGVEWTVLVEAALEQRLVPALSAMFRRINSPMVPADLTAALASFCDATRIQNERLLSTLESIVNELDKAGVQAIVFKGPLFAQHAYRDLSQKRSGDLDFLVRRSDVDTACRVLRGLGYEEYWHPPIGPMTPSQHRMYRRYQCEYQFVRPGDVTIVEPHWAVSMRMLAIDLDYDAFFDRSIRVVVRGTSAWSFSAEDLLLVLAVHGAKHEWNRLDWIRDLAALLHHNPGLDFDAALTRARAQGCGRVVAIGLALASRYGGVDPPRTIRDSYQADDEVGWLLERIEQRLFERPEEVPFTNLTWFRFRMRERRRDRVRYVLRTLFVPTLTHILMMRLPSSLLWLYYLVRPVHDYVALPIWLVFKGAVRNIRRVGEPGI